MRKDVKALVKLAESQGWQVTITRSNHVCFRSPEGKTTFTPSTPSDGRGMKNAKAQLRRNGLALP